MTEKEKTSFKDFQEKINNTKKELAALIKAQEKNMYKRPTAKDRDAWFKEKSLLKYRISLLEKKIVHLENMRRMSALSHSTMEEELKRSTSRADELRTYLNKAYTILGETIVQNS